MGSLQPHYLEKIMERVLGLGWELVEDVGSYYAGHEGNPFFYVCKFIHRESKNIAYVVFDEDNIALEALGDRQQAINLAQDYARRSMRYSGGML